MQDLAAVIRRFGSRQNVLVAHSYGASLTTRLLAEFVGEVIWGGG